MLKSKVKKIILREKQNNNEIAQQLAFLPLVRLRDGRAEVEREGAELLEDQCEGRTFLVGYESVSPTLLFTLYRNQSVLPPERTHSGIWVANYPRVDLPSDDQVFYLQIAATSPEDRTRLHIIASLLCSGLLINLQEISNLTHLSAVEGRVVHSAREKDDNRNRQSRKNELAHLILLGRGKGREPSIRRDKSEVNDILSRSHLYDQCRELYSGITLLHASFDHPNPSHLEALEAEIMVCASKNSSSKPSELTSGPFLSWYLAQVVGSLNRTGSVDMQACLQAIQLPEGYNAFQKSVQLYRLLVNKDYKEEGVQKLKEALQKHRQQALEEYKRHSNEASWLLRLCDYLDTKEQLLLAENQKALGIHNVQLLSTEYKHLLDRVTKEKATEAEAQRMVEKMITDYKSGAYGEQKFELLAEALARLNPEIYKIISERDSKGLLRSIEKEKAERKQLSDRINELEEDLRQAKKKSECCCEIM